MAGWPWFSAHVLEFLGMLKLVSDSFMEKTNAVFGCIIAFEQVRGMKFEVVLAIP